MTNFRNLCFDRLLNIGGSPGLLTSREFINFRLPRIYDDDLSCQFYGYCLFYPKFDSMRRSIRLIFILLLGCTILIGSCEREDVLIRHKHSLPVVEIEIDEKYLWSPDSGLYVIGDNGIHSGCNNSFPANYNQKWEFPALVRFIPAGEDLPAFEERVGFRIKGNCSREKAMKSIGLYWRKEYGNSSLEYPLFPGSGTEEFKRLLLRNSGNDFSRTQLKDAAIIQIFKDYARVEFQAYRPSVLYLNGEYWGIHNMRELITPHHFKFHYYVDDDLVDLLEGSPLSPEVDDGSSDAFLGEVIDFIKNNDLAVTENYLTISQRIDIGNLIDYMIIETYIGNWDWPVTNSKWWRENRADGKYNKWRWIAFDHDVAFTSKYVKDVWIGDLYGESDDHDKNPGFFIFNNLILNEDFTREFLSRYIFFIETVFDPVRVEDIIMGMKESLQDEYPRHQEKWYTLPEWRWEYSIDQIVSVNKERNEIMKEIIYALYEGY